MSKLCRLGKTKEVVEWRRDAYRLRSCFRLLAWTRFLWVEKFQFISPVSTIDWAFFYSWKCLSTISNLGTFYNSLKILIHIVDTRRSLNTFSCSWNISNRIVSTSLGTIFLNWNFSTRITSTLNSLGNFSLNW